MSSQTTIPVKKERDSNMELARIVAMASIVVLHFIHHGIFAEGWPVSYSQLTSTASIIFSFAAIFVMFGVDMFILISGYYGIRLTWKRFFSFWLLCAFYNLLDVFVSGDISFSTIGHALLISGTDQWFFRSYLWLLVASPLLNAGINALSLKQLRVVVALGFILTCISGWFLSNDNQNGHNVLQLLYMYIVGAYVHKETAMKNTSSCLLLSIYIVSCFLGCVFSRCYALRGMDMILGHNNPFVVISSVAIFVLFLKLSFKSRIVNFIAKSTPAVLLLSDMIFSSQVYGGIHSALISVGPTLKFFLILVVYLILIFLGSCVIDALRRLICEPIAIFMAKEANIITDKLCRQQ